MKSQTLKSESEFQSLTEQYHYLVGKLGFIKNSNNLVKSNIPDDGSLKVSGVCLIYPNSVSNSEFWYFTFDPYGVYIKTPYNNCWNKYSFDPRSISMKYLDDLYLMIIGYNKKVKEMHEICDGIRSQLNVPYGHASVTIDDRDEIYITVNYQNYSDKFKHTSIDEDNDKVSELLTKMKSEYDLKFELQEKLQIIKNNFIKEFNELISKYGKLTVDTSEDWEVKLKSDSGDIKVTELFK